MKAHAIAIYTSFALFIVFASGCATSQFMKSGDYTAAPRSPNCDFAVYTIPPTGMFKEVGVVVFNDPGLPTTPELAKENARDNVCRAGGNGLILAAPDNKIGTYARGTVIWVDK